MGEVVGEGEEGDYFVFAFGMRLRLVCRDLLHFRISLFGRRIN
jgi:hypothetical protein